MKKPLGFFLLSLVVLTTLIAINRWDIPVMWWLLLICSAVAFFSGIGWLSDL